MGYEVVVDALDTHTRTLRGLAGELRSARDQAAGVALGGDPYGHPGHAFTAAAGDLAAALLDALASAHLSLDAAADAVTASAETYRWQEHTVASGLRGGQA